MPYRVAGTAASSPPASPARDSETPEADSAPLPSASSPSAPGSSGSPAGSRDSAVAAGDARRRAAAAAEVAAAAAAAEDGSSGEDSAAAAGAAPAARRQDAARQQEVARQQEPRQRLVRTSSDNGSAEAGVGHAQPSAQPSGVVDVLAGHAESMQQVGVRYQLSPDMDACQQASADLAGSRDEQLAQPSQQEPQQPAAGQQHPAKILPAKRKADAVAAAPKLHDGWAKLAKLDAGSVKVTAPPAAAAAGAARLLPPLPPLRTGGTTKPQAGDVPSREQSRVRSSASAVVSDSSKPSLQRGPSDGRAAPVSRLQDDDSVFGERLLYELVRRSCILSYGCCEFAP